jgi:hypothetical protein
LLVREFAPDDTFSQGKLAGGLVHKAGLVEAAFAKEGCLARDPGPELEIAAEKAQVNFPVDQRQHRLGAEVNAPAHDCHLLQVQQGNVIYHLIFSPQNQPLIGLVNGCTRLGDIQTRYHRHDPKRSF